MLNRTKVKDPGTSRSGSRNRFGDPEYGSYSSRRIPPNLRTKRDCRPRQRMEIRTDEFIDKKNKSMRAIQLEKHRLEEEEISAKCSHSPKIHEASVKRKISVEDLYKWESNRQAKIKNMKKKLIDDLLKKPDSLVSKNSRAIVRKIRTGGGEPVKVEDRLMSCLEAKKRRLELLVEHEKNYYQSKKGRTKSIYDYPRSGRDGAVGECRTPKRRKRHRKVHSMKVDFGENPVSSRVDRGILRGEKEGAKTAILSNLEECVEREMNRKKMNNKGDFHKKKKSQTPSRKKIIEEMLREKNKEKTREERKTQKQSKSKKIHFKKFREEKPDQAKEPKISVKIDFPIKPIPLPNFSKTANLGQNNRINQNKNHGQILPPSDRETLENPKKIDLTHVGASQSLPVDIELGESSERIQKFLRFTKVAERLDFDELFEKLKEKIVKDVQVETIPQEEDPLIPLDVSYSQIFTMVTRIPIKPDRDEKEIQVTEMVDKNHMTDREPSPEPLIQKVKSIAIEKPEESKNEIFIQDEQEVDFEIVVDDDEAKRVEEDQGVEEKRDVPEEFKDSEETRGVEQGQEEISGDTEDDDVEVEIKIPGLDLDYNTEFVAESHDGRVTGVSSLQVALKFNEEGQNPETEKEPQKRNKSKRRKNKRKKESEQVSGLQSSSRTVGKSRNKKHPKKKQSGKSRRRRPNLNIKPKSAREKISDPSEKDQKSETGSLLKDFLQNRTMTPTRRALESGASRSPLAKRSKGFASKLSFKKTPPRSDKKKRSRTPKRDNSFRKRKREKKSTNDINFDKKAKKKKRKRRLELAPMDFSAPHKPVRKMKTKRTVESKKPRAALEGQGGFDLDSRVANIDRSEFETEHDDFINLAQNSKMVDDTDYDRDSQLNGTPKAAQIAVKLQVRPNSNLKNFLAMNASKKL